DFVAFARPRPALPLGLPVPYRTIGGGAVVELPWPPVWDFGRSFYVYQEVHGLPVLVAPPAGVLDGPRPPLRHPGGASPAAIAARGARWATVHLRLAAEEDGLRGAPGRPMPARQRQLYAREAERVVALLAGRWGSPAYADAGVLAWDLARRPSGGAGG